MVVPPCSLLPGINGGLGCTLYTMANFLHCMCTACILRTQRLGIFTQEYLSLV